MKTIKSKLLYVFVLFLVAGLVGCEGPEGPQGPAGADGIDGIDGTNGINGTNGTDGTDGADGADGNANVVIVNLLYGDITWVAGTYLGRTANVFSWTEPAVNADIMDHGTVLGYCYVDYADQWYSLPFIWEIDGGTYTQYVINAYALNTLTLYAYQTTGVTDPNALTEYRFLLITDNTVMKSTSGEQGILAKLAQAGVDVNNYYQVMDYFGLEY